MPDSDNHRTAPSTDRIRSSSPVVMITGASSGIGRATAHRFARDGARLVLCARGRVDLHAVAAECTDLGAEEVSVQPVDVSHRDEVDHVVHEMIDRYDGLDICVHSAAVMSYGAFLDTPADVFDATVGVDLLGAANVARSTLTVFRRQRSGHLIIIGSLLGRIATPWMSSYVTSKWGLRGLTRVLRQEARRYPGVSVSSVAPGAVRTPIYERAATYIGRAGSPPPPVASPDVVAAAVSKVVRNPRRERDADALFGLVNKSATAAFTVLPAVFDILAAPLLWRLGIARHPKDNSVGNVFHSQPAVKQAGTAAPDQRGSNLTVDQRAEPGQSKPRCDG
ncbi:SDR family NAD(P)-dependent oxidoreductase [Rhodococcus sp. Eu-32]|uniref:SDR family NAD(P)-dependent oxidoreductase n=1 Tax=Rhodococcus sp. Eu-32 TaxID=1017319 RepID=UPI000F7980AD|nr:SDR family NAD(P)-dependent oxidoreductase [Rhodococcus sp. Eu-32]RRQ26615.1 SDR family NAD(P)-dependent oxidoreductase [Rhodococcus sp. Eu-32]